MKKEHNVINPFLLWCIVTGMFYTSLLIIDYGQSRNQQPELTPSSYIEFPR